MGFLWGRRPSPGRRLAKAAGIRANRGAADLDLSREVAFQVMRPGSSAVARVLAVTEELLSDESAHEFAMSFLEQVQNLVSHRLPTFLPPEEVVQSLGPRSSACWATLTDFWAAVETWCLENRPPLKPRESVLRVHNTELQAMMWTSNRSLPAGSKIGVADALRYEKAGGAGLPGFSHLTAVLNNTTGLGQLPPTE
ncbi:hypothetical protein [Kutzneria sp. NPDC052558]|uniref:hypothetical protein n=1 Tax=Kutzneria sp. NPDC052558 TaxID=3364121 RepID=UPI0037C5458B